MTRLNLQNFLPYLLNRSGLRVGVMFSREIEHLGITLPMWRVLIELWHSGEHRLSDLSDRTSVDVSTLSRLLVTMQRKGLIAKGRSDKDARALSLRLTLRGEELVNKIAPRAWRYESIATIGMSQRDIKKLKELLQRVHENLENADPLT